MQRENGRVEVRPEIARVEEYVPGESLDAFSARTGVPMDRLIKLNSNESPYPPTPRVAAPWATFQVTISTPIPTPPHLTPRSPAMSGLDPAAYHHQQRQQRADHRALACLPRPWRQRRNQPADIRLYTTATTFAGGEMMRRRAARTSTWTFPAIIAALRKDTKLIMVCSPNNPTGNSCAAPRYRGAARHRAASSWWTRRMSNSPARRRWPKARSRWFLSMRTWSCLRTLSKWAGLAGMRLGYGAFPAWLVPHVRKLQLPFEVNLAAHIAAHATLADLPFLQERIQQIIAERERLCQMLSTHSFLRAFPSRGNFVLFEITDPDLPLSELRQQMEANGILIRYFRTPDLARHARITVGTPEHTEAIDTVLTQIGKARMAATTASIAH